MVQVYATSFVQSIVHGHLGCLQSCSVRKSAVLKSFVYVSSHTCANMHLCHLHKSTTAGLKDIHISTLNFIPIHGVWPVHDGIISDKKIWGKGMWTDLSEWSKDIKVLFLVNAHRE